MAATANNVARPVPRTMLDRVRAYPILVLGILATVLPTLYSVMREAWTLEANMHGPLVLATGLWLIWQRWPAVKAEAKPGNLKVALPFLLIAAAVYVFGKAYNFLMLEVGALWLGGVAVSYAFVGFEVMKKLWFPVLYALFLIPIPGWALDTITQPLKLLVSDAVVNGLGLFDFPIARIGVTIYVAQYQLLVEDACAGLHSLISLTAIGLFYIYLLHNASWRYSLLLLCFVLPIAIAANIVRVAILVLLTYYAGNDVAQGYLHGFAGLVTFVAALLLIFLLDRVLLPIAEWVGRRRSAPQSAPREG